jgi:hypothetical protein
LVTKLQDAQDCHLWVVKCWESSPTRMTALLIWIWHCFRWRVLTATENPMKLATTMRKLGPRAGILRVYTGADPKRRNLLEAKTQTLKESMERRAPS